MGVESKALQPLGLGNFGVLVLVTPLDEGPGASSWCHRRPRELAQTPVLLFFKELVLIFVQGVKLQLQNAPLGFWLNRFLHNNLIQVNCARAKDIEIKITIS